MYIGSMLGSLFNFFKPTLESELDDKFNPRQILVRSDRQAINKQRRQLISQFGFEDTISGSRIQQQKAGIAERQARETLIANRGKVNRGK